MRSKGVADGKRVNIPVPSQVRYHDGVTQKASLAKSYGYGRWNQVGGPRRQIRAGINAEMGVRSRKTRK